MTLIPTLHTHWAALRPILYLRNARDYNRAIRCLNALLDEVGADGTHPLFGLLDTLGILILAYEEQHYPLPQSGGAEMLKYLMEEHSVTQSGLPEIGSQGVVSEILNGKRQLNVRQIRALAKRFHVSPAVFL